MINPKELRIGNYIIDDDGLIAKINGFEPLSHKVRCDDEEGCELLIDVIEADGQINFGRMAESTLCRPIPLTPEWLEKLGFEKEEKDGKSVGIEKYYVFTNEPFVYNSIHGYWLHGRHMGIQPTYLHQLQNLYFALTGKELELKNN